MSNRTPLARYLCSCFESGGWERVAEEVRKMLAQRDIKPEIKHTQTDKHQEESCP